MINNIGSIYKSKGNKQQARFYYEKAKSIYKKKWSNRPCKRFRSENQGIVIM
jgi:predicted negative regulator of RcsB-dependent stress response